MENKEKNYCENCGELIYGEVCYGYHGDALCASCWFEEDVIYDTYNCLVGHLNYAISELKDKLDYSDNLAREVIRDLVDSILE